MTALRRWWCARRGHGGSRMYVLPESVFGLYAFSRIECMRCGATLAENPNPTPMVGITGPILQEDVDDYYGGVVPEGRWVLADTH